MISRKTPDFRTDSAGNVVVQEGILVAAAWGATVLSPPSGDLSEAQAQCMAGGRRYLARDFAGALEEYRAAASIAETAHGQDHCVTAYYLNQVGAVLKILDRNEEALSMHLEVLRIREATIPPDAPEIAHSCNNVATVLEGLGRTAETGPYYSRAIRIEGQVVGRSGDPNLATRLNQVSALYLAGQLHEAARLVTGIVDDLARRHFAGDMPNRPLAAECLQLLAKVKRAAGRRTFKGRHEVLLREYGLA